MSADEMPEELKRRLMTKAPPKVDPLEDSCEAEKRRMNKLVGGLLARQRLEEEKKGIAPPNLGLNAPEDAYKRVGGAAWDKAASDDLSVNSPAGDPDLTS